MKKADTNETRLHLKEPPNIKKFKNKYRNMIDRYTCKYL